ncbi:DUF5623 domain-containing protein [Pedobacter psychrodurus]|uniref:DUF5623 domain-containing protein n=1 Tax=Pedobacter psychrodurus TaxID=2530456 RepID=UPI00292F8CF3|nr:DUF5623 domain-containing protein [Pedobacter psychrodurus]
MKIKSTTGPSALNLKRKAKRLKKELRISHTEALNLIAMEQGAKDWKSFIERSGGNAVEKAVVQKLKIPQPATLDYHSFMTGAVIGQHPNGKMAVQNHARVGNLLQTLLEATEYHKRANNHLMEIRRTLDTWLGCEYNEKELENKDFNRIYYGGNGKFKFGPKPSLSQQAELKRYLRKAESILARCYHDCGPFAKLIKRFKLVSSALEKWPKSIRIPIPGYDRGQIQAGKFVRLRGTENIGIVFNHDLRHQTVEGYSDKGRFVYGRHEVRVLRKQLELVDFKPMRLKLPYGKWKCEDGREVLFNRDYCPIWEKFPDGNVRTIAPNTYVAHEESEFYYDDGSAPYYDNASTEENCVSVLKAWGVEEKNPIVIDLIPLAIANRDFRLLSPKNMS